MLFSTLDAYDESKYSSFNVEIVKFYACSLMNWAIQPFHIVFAMFFFF